MASLLLDLLQSDEQAPRRYFDKANYSSFEEQQLALETSATCYVGNLSYHTREEFIYELAREAGPIKRIIMGLNRTDKTPCGFAFVEYFSRTHCLAAQFLLTGKQLEGRLVKFELDPGFKEGRQFGRGSGGGQVRDEVRTGFDQDRGGFGAQAKPAPLASASLETNMTLESSIQAHRRYAPQQQQYPQQQRRGGRRDRSRDPAPGSRYNQPPPPPPSLSHLAPLTSSRGRRVDEFGRDLVDE